MPPPTSLCVTVFLWGLRESEQSASLLGFLFQDGWPPCASAEVDGFFLKRATQAEVWIDSFTSLELLETQRKGPGCLSAALLLLPDAEDYCCSAGR